MRGRDPGSPPAVLDEAVGTPERAWALFLDIDGTLFDLVDDPRSVRADAGLLDLLDRCADRFGGAMALVSGRELQDIDRIMAPRNYAAAGCHGAELRVGRTLEAAGADPADLALLAGDLRRLASGEERPWVECKARSIAMHFRGRGEAARRSALDLAQRALARLGDGYRILPGKDVIELAPAAADKGTAIARLLDHPPFRDRCPVFAGDDLTDEHGFTVVNRLGGLSIRIGKGDDPTEARHVLPSPDALRGWLLGLLPSAVCIPFHNPGRRS